MAWLKVEKGVCQHHKILRAARMLRISRFEMAGIMVAIWDWFDSHACGGNPAEIQDCLADAIGWGGDNEELVNALIVSRLLDECEDRKGLSPHNWLGRQGDREERAQRARERKAAYRALRDKTECPTGQNGMSHGTKQDVPAMSSLRTEENRTEENRTEDPPPTPPEDPPKKKRTTKGDLLADPLLLERMTLRQAFRGSGILAGDAEKMTSALIEVSRDGRLDEIVASAQSIAAWYNRHDAEERRMWTMGRILHEYDAIKNQLATGPPGRPSAVPIPHAY